jgi:membrane-bound serine protease (ClpP class)
MAAHVAVMKSGSQIGSCQPVSVTGEPITETKYVNYLTGLMRSHAWLHSRNETAAELFVTENLNLHAEEAFRFKVIDLIADNLQDALSKLTNHVLVKYKDGEASRFILAKKEKADKYEVIQSWDFENIKSDNTRV